MHEHTHRALSHLKEIEAAVAGRSPGPDPAEHARLTGLVLGIQWEDSYVTEKKGKLTRALGVFFSARTWQAHPEGESGVRADIRRNLRALAEHFAALGAP